MVLRRTPSMYTLAMPDHSSPSPIHRTQVPWKVTDMELPASIDRRAVPPLWLLQPCVYQLPVNVSRGLPSSRRTQVGGGSGVAVGRGVTVGAHVGRLAGVAVGTGAPSITVKPSSQTSDREPAAETLVRVKRLTPLGNPVRESSKARGCGGSEKRSTVHSVVLFRRRSMPPVGARRP